MFFLRTKTCFFKKNKKTDWKKQKRKWVDFLLEKNCFFSTLDIFRSFCDFPLVTRSGTSHVITSLIGCAPHTYSIGPWYRRSWELLAFQYVRNSVDNKTSFEKLNPCSMRKYPYNRKNHLQHLNFYNFTLWMPGGVAPFASPLCTPLELLQIVKQTHVREWVGRKKLKFVNLARLCPKNRGVW